jgi:hypothetical protein
MNLQEAILILKNGGKCIHNNGYELKMSSDDFIYAVLDLDPDNHEVQLCRVDEQLSPYNLDLPQHLLVGWSEVLVQVKDEIEKAQEEITKIIFKLQEDTQLFVEVVELFHTQHHPKELEVSLKISTKCV